MALKPLTYEDPLYQLLREGNVKEFNQRKAQGEKCELTSCDFRDLDLRGLDAAGIDFTDCYFRAADLRGVDFSKACLVGASIKSTGQGSPAASSPLSSMPTRSRSRSSTALACATTNSARAILAASAKFRRATPRVGTNPQAVTTDIEAIAPRQSSQSIWRRRNVGMSYLSSSS